FIIIILYISFLLTAPLPAQDQFIPEEEAYKQRTISEKTGLVRSQLTGNFKKISGNIYSLKRSGKGNYGNYQDITWNIESEIGRKKGLLYPLYTLFTIKDKANREVYSSKTEYDYKENSILVTQKYINDEKPEISTFSLKPRTADYSTFIYFLRPFMEYLSAGKTVKFNFVTSEPKLYKLKARLVKEDHLTIGAKKVEAVKIQITPDMGPLNGPFERFVPSTSLWYDKNPPHAWLKYEGLEFGRGSLHIVTTVEEIPKSVFEKGDNNG
ncbi:MAG: hypothetical protein KJ687_09585, partial [Proteobacteria bacterium]|nr:hypothetical protein [Pseudomonadota bacterium]